MTGTVIPHIFRTHNRAEHSLEKSSSGCRSIKRQHAAYIIIFRIIKSIHHEANKLDGIDHRPSMSDVLFKIARSGVITGDFSLAQVQAGLASGNILGSDHYYDQDMKAWRLVREKDWQAGARKPELKEKSSWWSWDWFWTMIGLGIVRLVFKLLAKGRHDEQVMGWTIIIAVIVSVAYFIIRDNEVSPDGSSSPDAASRPRYLWTLYAIMLSAIIVTGASFTKKGEQAWRDLNPLRDKFSYEVWCDFDREIFPSFEIAFSKLNDAAVEKIMVPEKGEAHEFNQEKHGASIGLRLFDVRKGDRYEIKVQSDGRTPLISESTYAFTADQDQAHSIAYPRLTFDYAQLRAATQTRPINLKFTASRNGGTPLIVTQTWHLRQINDCPIAVSSRRLQSDGTIKMESANVAIITFAGFVNENHPSIPKILDEALSAGGLTAFTGYQEGTNLSVLRQLNAIWLALEKKGIRYSSINTTTGSKTAVQHVRLLEDTLRTRQANCVDGSTLFASIATKIGLDAYLILAPGHCFVAIDMPETKPIGIEMTMLGSDAFLEAVAVATTKADYSLRRNQKKYDEADPESGYTLVPIAFCRELGIQPIPASK